MKIGDQPIDGFEFKTGQDEQAGGSAAGPDHLSGRGAARSSFQGAHAGGADGDDAPAILTGGD